MALTFVGKIETMVAKWYKALPHLPVGGQKWLGQNAWWIVIIGVALSALGLLFAIGGIVTLATLTTTLGTYDIYYASTYNPGWPIFVGILGLAFLVATVIVEATAISPLKTGQKKGWSLLFLALLISLVSVVLTSLLDLNIIGLIFGVIGVAIAGYFLFEIRSQFALVAATAKK